VFYFESTPQSSFIPWTTDHATKIYYDNVTTMIIKYFLYFCIKTSPSGQPITTNRADIAYKMATTGDKGRKRVKSINTIAAVSQL
jgi:hypothetical protein